MTAMSTGQLQMAKTNTLGIRLDEKVRKALEKAAKEEQRTLSAMAQIALADWLKGKGYLK
jgi:hypothetical protein